MARSGVDSPVSEKRKARDVKGASKTTKLINDRARTER